MGKASMDESIKMLKYKGNPYHFASWKDKVLVHLQAMTDERCVAELLADRDEPKIKYQDLLLSQPSVPPLEKGASDKAKRMHKLHEAFLQEQASHIKKLLMATLPANFTGDEKRMKASVHMIWRAIEQRYGLNTASGVVGLMRKFDEVAVSDFKSIHNLMYRLEVARGQVNRNTQDALGVDLISTEEMLVKVLSILPAHLWGSAVEFKKGEFTPDKVGDKLRAIFGNKSKAQIGALDNQAAVNHVQTGHIRPKKTVLGKRKAAQPPVQDMHYNLGYMKCHYCAGTHNDMNNVGPDDVSFSRQKNNGHNTHSTAQ